MDEGKAAVAALVGYVVVCLEAAMVMNALTALSQGSDVLGAMLFRPGSDIVLTYALGTAVMAVPIFLVFRCAFRIFQLRHWFAFAFGGAVAATASMLALGGVKEAVAFAVAGAVAGNLYREGEELVRRRRLHRMLADSA